MAGMKQNTATFDNSLIHGSGSSPFLLEHDAMNKVIRAFEEASFLADKLNERELKADFNRLVSDLNSLFPLALELAKRGIQTDPEAYGRLASLLSEESLNSSKVWIEVELAEHAVDDDEGIVGTCLIHVPSYLSDELKAAVALDAFHDSVAIDDLENYDIIPILYPEQPSSYENGQLASLATYIG